MSDSELTEGLHRGCSFFPQPLSRLAATAPRPGSLLVCAITAQKPALKGEVAMSDSELTEGLHRGCSFFRQPLSRHAATAPRPGSLLVCATTNPKACPERGGGNER